MALHQALYKALTRPILIRLKTESDTHIAKWGVGVGREGESIGRRRTRLCNWGSKIQPKKGSGEVSFGREKMSM